MLKLKYLKIGAESFALPFGDADEVEALRRTDPQAALALARRRNRPNMADQSVLHVPLSITDAMPPELARMASLASAAGAQTMTATIRVGDADIAADPRVIAEFARMQAALNDRRATLSDVEALRIAEAANRSPATARGRYIASLEAAHRSPPTHA